MTPSNHHSLWLNLRFIGYLGVQCHSLLVPLLVYAITKSGWMAGAALFIEWLPKLGLYVAGGTIAQRFGYAKTHIGLDAFRLLAALGLLVCAISQQSLWLLAGCAAIYQCTNALSNILFERAVTRWWLVEERQTGHANMLQRDLWACGVILILGLILHRYDVIAVMGVLTQLVGFTSVYLFRKKLYPTEETPMAEGMKWYPQFIQSLTCLRVPMLRRLTLSAGLLAFPGALIFSVLPFYTARIDPTLLDDTAWLSGLNLGRTIVSIGILQLIKQVTSPTWNHRLPYIGFLTLGIGCSCIIPVTPIPFFIGALLLMSISGAFMLPLMRHYRQLLVERHVDPIQRAGATGVLIAVEAMSYLAAAVAMLLGSQHLAMMTAIALSIAVYGGIVFRRIMQTMSDTHAA